MIEIIQGDITRLQVDAVVNAANSALQRGGGVDGAIHHAAGPQLQAYNNMLGGCDVGTAKLAPGFGLPARYIIHTVGPVWQGGGHGEAELLASCYRKSLQLAASNGVKQIAFPAISTGIFGYPLEAAAGIALTVMLEHEGQFEKIYACCFNRADSDVYEKVLRELRQ